MKYVYVLSSCDKDIYLEQTFISVYSLRLHMPEANVVVVVDNNTNDTLNGYRNKIREIADVVVVKIDDEFSQMERSRWLKTNLGNIIEGRFLYIDSDTIVTRRIDWEFLREKVKIGAIPDSHVPIQDHPLFQKYRKICLKFGIDLKNEKYYFNGGVLYSDGSEEACRFFSQWHKNWLDGRRLGIRADQPSLAKTNAEMLHIVQEMDNRMNCHIMCGINYLSGAYIIHYFSSNFLLHEKDYPYILMNEDIFLKFKRERCEMTSDVLEIIAEPTSCFTSVNEIVSGRDVYLLHTYTFRLFRRFYYRLPLLYQTIEGFIKFIKNLK